MKIIPKNKAFGYTLIEILIAMWIVLATTVVIGSLYVILHFAIKFW